MLGEVNLNCGGFQFVNAISRPLAVNIVVHFLGGFQATFLIRNHSNVHSRSRWPFILIRKRHLAAAVITTLSYVSVFMP